MGNILKTPQDVPSTIHPKQKQEKVKRPNPDATGCTVSSKPTDQCISTNNHSQRQHKFRSTTYLCTEEISVDVYAHKPISKKKLSVDICHVRTRDEEVQNFEKNPPDVSGIQPKKHRSISNKNPQDVSGMPNIDDVRRIEEVRKPQNYKSIMKKKSLDICDVRIPPKALIKNMEKKPKYFPSIPPKCWTEMKKPNHLPTTDCPIVLSDATGHDISSRYILGIELGRGEFGVTYLCTDKISGDVYACKSISKKNFKEKSVDIGDVRREVQIMRRLPHHPNIVGLKDTYEDHSNVHIVMDLCQGGELFDSIVTKNRHTEHDAASIIKTIVQVVQKCHEHGVMHRDLKPENFLYENKKAISPLKAIDFGLSITFTPGERFRQIVGSPLYMAPEVLRRNYGPEIDIWSAGVILYVLLSGSPPFTIDTDHQFLIREILHTPLDFGRDPWPKVSYSAKDLVKRMLNRNATQRLTAQQVLDHPWLLQCARRTSIPRVKRQVCMARTPVRKVVEISRGPKAI